jgi:hypothetical protein
MQAASLLDGFPFELFPPFENGLAAPEVDVSRRQVVQALVVSPVVVVPDELLDALFELSLMCGLKSEEAADEAPRVHIAHRRRGGNVAARGIGSWVSKHWPAADY